MTTDGYVFDAYGTLFDVHAAVRKHADELGSTGTQLSQIWRTKQLEYSWVRALMGSYKDFWKLTEEALDFAMAATGVDDPALRNRLLEAYWTLECFAEVPETLERLRKDGNTIAILSNGSPDMLSAAVESAGLSALIDEVFCVDAVKTFKTAPEVYRMITESWDCEPAGVAFVSSNRWDIAAAVKFGFQATWINRTDQPDEYLNYAPRAVIGSLEGLGA